VGRGKRGEEAKQRDGGGKLVGRGGLVTRRDTSNEAQRKAFFARSKAMATYQTKVDKLGTDSCP